MEDKLNNIVRSGDIEVSKKTLMHVSEGIYRSAGSAIKELISNSFDANATKVVLSTNYPLFDILTCQDNGDGMTEEEFLRIVQGGIGDSKKSYISADGGRPLIGRLGIGLLAIAQICRSFTVISHNSNTKTAFQGRMIFRTDVDKLAKEKPIQSSYEIGKWELAEPVSYDPSKKGVLIFTKDLRQAFSKHFRGDKNQKNSIPLLFDKLIALFYNSTRMVKEQGPYLEMIWELCCLSPLPYFNNNAVRHEYLDKILKFNIDKENLKFENAISFLSKKQEELNNYNFTVIVDGIRLYRPIILPSPASRFGKLQQSQIFYFEYDNIVRGRKLRCYGYFLAQEMAIKPRDLIGLQIRIKNVGIGIHDATFLKYGKIESPRDKWLSGEIYVEEGLESALNIDRDSFNENDEHYFILKKEVHEFLEEIVFPTISSYQRKRSNSRKEEIAKNRNKYIRSELINIFSRSISKDIRFIESNKLVFENNSVLLPIALVQESYRKRLDVFSSNLVLLIEHLRSKDLSSGEIDIFIKRFSSIVLA